MRALLIPGNGRFARQRATDDAWIFSRLDGPKASWMTPERLAEQRRMLPAIAYSRLWLNQWSTGGGDALTPEVIDRAFHAELQPMTSRGSSWLFVAGVDLGLTRDCAAVVVLAVPAGGSAGKIRLAHNRLWRPPSSGKINLLDVERHILNLDEQFGLEAVSFDSFQCEHLAQTLEADADHRRRNARRVHWAQPWMREIPPTPSNLRLQASMTIEFFNDFRIQLYPCEPLHRDLHKLRVEEKSYGMRLTSPRDGDGHGDTFSAFALALLMANEVAGTQPILITSLFDRQSDSYDAAFARRLAEYQREQQEMTQLTSNDDFCDAVCAGRVTVVGSANPFA